MKISLGDRRGFTLIEAIMASALMAVFSVLVASGMIIHARAAYANIHQERITDSARRLIQNISADMADSQFATVRKGAVDNDSLTIYKPDLNGTTSTVTYRFVKGANYPASMGENIIIKNYGADPTVTTGTVIARMVSPLKVKNTDVGIFIADPQVPNLINIQARIGDRTYPPSEADNLWTGRGFQSFLINTSIGRR